jgi:Protein of unknown function (DUF2798)
MKKIPTKYTPILFAAIMSFCMALIMTGFVTALNYGLNTEWPKHWAQAFVFAYPLAFVCVLLLAGPVRKLVNRLVA